MFWKSCSEVACTMVEFSLLLSLYLLQAVHLVTAATVQLFVYRLHAKRH